MSWNYVENRLLVACFTAHSLPCLVDRNTTAISRNARLQNRDLSRSFPPRASNLFLPAFANKDYEIDSNSWSTYQAVQWRQHVIIIVDYCFFYSPVKSFEILETELVSWIWKWDYIVPNSTRKARMFHMDSDKLTCTERFGSILLCSC